MTLGALIARVCRIAAQRASGWRITGVTGGMSIAVEFTDKSAAAATPMDVEVTKEGEDAQAFVEEYHVTIYPTSIPEDGSPNEPDDGPQP